jgi:hypothetical protein
MRCNCVHIFIALVFFSSCPSFAQTSFIKEIHLTPHFNNKGNAISMGVNYSLYFTDTAAVHDVELKQMWLPI